jgi:hypothetical protein
MPVIIWREALPACWRRSGPSALVVRQSEKNLSSAAKARIHFARFMYGLKPVTFKLRHYLRFLLLEPQVAIERPGVRVRTVRNK